MSFTSLPFELRSYIWRLAVTPRRITNIRAKKSKGNFSKEQRQQGKDILYEITSTPPPALMHVCHESRQEAPYQRAFTAGTEPRWTWVNFDLDIFSISSLYDVEGIVSHRYQVQQLQIQTADTLDWYESATYYDKLNILFELESLREIQIILEPGALTWGDVYAEWGFGSCPRYNITFLDRKSGLVFTGSQLKMVGDWQMVFSFDSQGNPPAPDRLSDEINHALDDSWHMTLAQMHKIN
ncbi:hypothetical protein GGI43DRAFT_398760 [Trichoderma evansii]